MRSQDKKTFYYHADASTLGGFIEAPFPRVLPPHASVSLPSVGGEVKARSESLNFEEIVSCKAAYTHVTGRKLDVDGPWSMTATAVVEGLSILETFTADRLVTRVSVEYPKDGGNLRVSVAGSTFDGLRVGGCDATPSLNPLLVCGARTEIGYPHFVKSGRKQADAIKKAIQGYEKEASCEGQRPKDFGWLRQRFQWMETDRKLKEDQCVVSSLVDGVHQTIPALTFGHVLDIPDFGVIFLGEVIACKHSLQVFSFRAELGCGTKGNVTGPTAQVHGVTSPPS